MNPTAPSTRSDSQHWKNQTLTPNPDTLYFMPFFSSKDVGPAGMDQGKDGQHYLFVTRDKMAIR